MFQSLHFFAPFLFLDLGFFVSLDSRSAARPMLGLLFWDFLLETLKALFYNPLIFHHKEPYTVIYWQIGAISVRVSSL